MGARWPSRWNRGIIMSMATFHISETDAARDFAGLLARVRAGAEVVIESDAYPVVVLHTPAPSRRSIEECIALFPADSPVTIARTSPAMLRWQSPPIASH